MIKEIKMSNPFLLSLTYATNEEVSRRYKEIMGKPEEGTIITLYHGSDKEVKVEDIILPGPRKECDFGAGFYLTDRREIAEEWVCNKDNPIVNEYRLDISKETILHLEDRDWLHVVLAHRDSLCKVRFKSNVIVGEIADDKLFQSLSAFSDGLIGDKRLINAIKICDLGKQYIFKNNVKGLSFVRFIKMDDISLDLARKRKNNRRAGLRKSISNVYKTLIVGEEFYDDYEKKGDYVEY